MRTSFWRIVICIIIIVFLATACGSKKRSFPPEAKKTFEAYIAENATGIDDANGNPNSTPAYLVNWAPKYHDLGDDFADGWCVLMGALVRIRGEYAYSFLVYRTTDNQWHISSSDADYEKAGCGN